MRDVEVATRRVESAVVSGGHVQVGKRGATSKIKTVGRNLTPNTGLGSELSFLRFDKHLYHPEQAASWPLVVTEDHLLLLLLFFFFSLRAAEQDSRIGGGNWGWYAYQFVLWLRTASSGTGF